MILKKISIALIAIISASLSYPAAAEERPVVAIIDSGFDSRQVSSNLVQEICINSINKCNNGKSLDSGIGAAGYSGTIAQKHMADWNHGNDMAKIIVEENPAVGLILIRNAKIYGQTLIAGSEKDFEMSLKWVYENADRYNIVAVSMSRGSHSYVSSNKQLSSIMGNIKVTNNMISDLRKRNSSQKIISMFENKLKDLNNQLYSLGRIECPASDVSRSLISQLISKDIATIVATGNDADNFYVDNPACLDDAIAITSYDGRSISGFANVAPNTDFATIGNSTSQSTARFAGKWSRQYSGSFSKTYDMIKENGKILDKHSVIGVY